MPQRLLAPIVHDDELHVVRYFHPTPILDDSPYDLVAVEERHDD